MSRIGFQNGVEAARLRMKKLDPGGFKPDGTGAWDKFFRTVSHLVVEHDQQFPPTPPPPPPPPPGKYAPQTYNKGSNGQDARYCTAGLPKIGPYFVDEMGCRYDDKGLEVDGRRTGKFVAGLKPADEMDQREPCDPYNGMPPWPAGSYEA